MRVLSLEHVIRRAPLGLKIVDAVRNIPVTDGLRVLAWPISSDPQPVYHREQAIIAQRSPMSGNYGFAELPGLRAYQVGDAEASDWCPPVNGVPPNGANANFVVLIEDLWGRFLPRLVFHCLPKEQPVEAMLYSAPGRLKPTGFFALYGQVCRMADTQAAPWAVIQAHRPDRPTQEFVGVTNKEGAFALFVNFPRPRGKPHTTDLSKETWKFTFDVMYQTLPDTAFVRIDDDSLPDWHTIQAQDAANIYSTLDDFDTELVRDLGLQPESILQTNLPDPKTDPTFSEEKHKKLTGRLLVDPA